MKLVTFFGPKNPSHAHVGILYNNSIIDFQISNESLDFKNLALTRPALDTGLSMIRFIEDQAETLPLARKLLELAQEERLTFPQFISAAHAKLLAPIPKPSSMRDGYAFRQHVESARKGRGLPMIPEFDLFPVFYFTNHLSVTGPGPISVQKETLNDLDFELEVAIVIGKRGKNIPAARADDHIFGYMIMNDWSARSLQREEMKMSLGPAKGKDFATSLGPMLVTRDELEPFATKTPVGEKHKLAMKCFVNGKEVSSGSLDSMNWTFGQILERASYGVMLTPGEVIGSGTVGTGCFMELNATFKTNNWLQPGDTVVMEVEQLGRLENIIREEREDYIA